MSYFSFHTQKKVSLNQIYGLLYIQKKVSLIQGISFTKIRPQVKIDNFAFKNSNIIIERLT